ncbi:hypothetical protein [Coxiella-like endosymbiont]|uniref:hypothetical protein n=1 Tax=Coxiella-like endosymbiont TaxID=1592897 RepID=UPI00272A132E|nr:hypothetical protein [Coxiella-like endosymbiont]
MASQDNCSLQIISKKILDSLYVYYGDRIFHRVGEPKNTGLIVTPSNYTILILEMTCEYGNAKWKSEKFIKKRLFSDLAVENICKKRNCRTPYFSQQKMGILFSP